MKPTVKFVNNEGAPSMIDIDTNDKYDTHFKSYSPEDYLQKCAFLLYRKFGWNGHFHTSDTAVIDAFKLRYHIIDGEDAYDYLQWLPSDTPETNWNGCIAVIQGYDTYKKLIATGFKKSMAAKTAYNFALILVNPDRHEIMSILGIKQIED